MSSISACPLIPGAVKTLLLDSADLDGVTVVTGESRKAPNEWVAIGMPRADRPEGLQAFGAWREDGTMPILCQASVPGAGEDAVTAAHDRAWEIAEAVVCAFDFVEGGDATLGGIIYSSDITAVADVDDAVDEVGSASGHSHTVEITFTWNAGST